MMKIRYSKRRLDTLILLAVLGTPGFMMAATAGAAESFFSKPNFADLQDGDITLASAEHGGADIHMSLVSPSTCCVNSQSQQVVTGTGEALPGVYFSLRLPW